MSDYVPVTPGSGANIGALPATMPDSSTAYVSAGVLGLISGGNWVAIASGSPLPVTVENSSVAITVEALPLPTGAATAANQSTANGYLETLAGAVSGGSVAVTGTFWQTTQPVSAVSLPLPTGAATAAKQPALGTAGTASTDVLSVQGVASMTALKVDGSAVTQPVSGTFWPSTQPISGTVTANAGTNLNTSALALESGGNLATLAAAVTASKVQVNITNASIPVTGTFWQTTQPISGSVTANAGTGTFAVSAASLPLPTGAAQDSSVNGLLVAQASTTSGQSGPLVQGAVTTSAPSYTTGKTEPLSLTPAGALRVDASATTQPVSGTFWQATQPVSGTFWQATQPVSLASLPALAAGTNTIGNVNAIQAGDTIEIAGTTYTVQRAFANCSASGNTTVVAGTSSKNIYVLAYAIGPVSAAVNVYWNGSPSGALSSTKYLAANGGMGRAIAAFAHVATTTTGENLQLNLSAAVNVGVDVLYIVR